MKKIILLEVCLLITFIAVNAQRAWTVTLTTNTPLREALRTCKRTGELNYYFTKDYDDTTSSFSIELHPLYPTIAILVNGSRNGQKTILNLRLEVIKYPGTAQAAKRLEYFSKSLQKRLENLESGPITIIQEEEIKSRKKEKADKPQTKTEKELSPASQPIFTSVQVIDNRFDTSNIIQYEQQGKQIITVRLDTTTSASLKKWIEEAVVRATPAGKDLPLLIELRSLEKTDPPAVAFPRSMHFSATLYCQAATDAFVPFASFDTIITKKGVSTPSKAQWIEFIHDETTRIIRDVIEQSKLPSLENSDKITLAAIRQGNAGNRWAQSPIYRAAHYPDGLYEFYQCFKRNQVDNFGLTVLSGKDSVYEVIFTDTSTEKRRQLQNWMQVTLNRAIISYKDSLYLMVHYPVCLPLKKMKGSFYFYVPSSQPNMFYQDLLEREQERGQPTESILGPDILWNIGKTAVSEAVMAERENRLTKHGLQDQAFRTGYVDLDNFMIRYY